MCYRWAAAYPNGEDEWSEETAEGPWGTGWNMPVPVGVGGWPAGGSGLRGLHLCRTNVLFHLSGLWFLGGSPEATTLLETGRTPDRQACSLLVFQGCTSVTSLNDWGLLLNSLCSATWLYLTDSSQCSCTVYVVCSSFAWPNHLWIMSHSLIDLCQQGCTVSTQTVKGTRHTKLNWLDGSQWSSGWCAKRLRKITHSS